MRISDKVAVLESALEHGDIEPRKVRLPRLGKADAIDEDTSVKPGHAILTGFVALYAGLLIRSALRSYLNVTL